MTTSDSSAPEVVRWSKPSLWMWCPACEEVHPVSIRRGWWTWDGDLRRPTITPSIKVTGTQWEPGMPFHAARHKVPPGSITVCHSWVTNGQWRYLPDCTHDLAGQTVDVPPVPAELGDADGH